MVVLEHQEELSETEVIWVRESKIRQSSCDDLRGRAAEVIQVKILRESSGRFVERVWK